MLRYAIEQSGRVDDHCAVATEQSARVDDHCAVATAISTSVLVHVHVVRKRPCGVKRTLTTTVSDDEVTTLLQVNFQLVERVVT